MYENAATEPFWIDELAGEESRARVGLTEPFLELIEEEVVGLELARPGMALVAGDLLGFLHTATRTLDLRLPFPLKVLAVNEEAVRDARLVRVAPYGRGWLAEVQLL